MKIAGSIEIDVLKHEFKCDLTWYLPYQDNDLVFIIHKSTEFNNVSINGFDVVPEICESNISFMQESIIAKLAIPECIRDKQLNISFTYSASLKILPMEINQISEEYIELNCYTPWFPALKDFVDFESDIRVKGLEHYLLIDAQKDNKDWLIKGNDKDIAIIGFKSYVNKTIQINDKQIVITSIDEKESIALLESISELFSSFTEYYNKILPPCNKDTLNIILANRNDGGGYYRNNKIIITPDLDEINEYDSWLAHEYSHNWFLGADVHTWEDWLNESFAEYSALLYMWEKGFQNYYTNALKKFKDLTSDCPPIKDSIRHSDSGGLIRYKGVILLHECKETFGIDSMYQLYNILIELDTKTTANLIKALIVNKRDDIANFMSLHITK